MRGSVKLKKAILSGKVIVTNPNGAGEVKVFLYDSKTSRQFSLDVPGASSVELAPKYCACTDLLNSRNLEDLLRNGALKIG